MPRRRPEKVEELRITLGDKERQLADSLIFSLQTRNFGQAFGAVTDPLEAALSSPAGVFILAWFLKEYMGIDVPIPTDFEDISDAWSQLMGALQDGGGAPGVDPGTAPLAGDGYPGYSPPGSQGQRGRATSFLGGVTNLVSNLFAPLIMGFDMIVRKRQHPSTQDQSSIFYQGPQQELTEEQLQQIIADSQDIPLDPGLRPEQEQNQDGSWRTGPSPGVDY